MYDFQILNDIAILLLAATSTFLKTKNAINFSRLALLTFWSQFTIAIYSLQYTTTKQLST